MVTAHSQRMDHNQSQSATNGENMASLFRYITRCFLGKQFIATKQCARQISMSTFARDQAFLTR